MKNPTLSDIRLDPSNADQRGRLPVFSIKEKKWIWRYPVDVREMVASGFGTVEETDETGPMPRPR